MTSSEQVHPVLPCREVQVAAVAHGPGQHHRAERGTQPVPMGDGADRLLDQDQPVCSGDRVGSGRRRASSWPAAYSGWNCSTGTDCAVSASTGPGRSREHARSHASFRMPGRCTPVGARRCQRTTRPRTPSGAPAPRLRPNRSSGGRNHAGTPVRLTPSWVRRSAGAHAHPGCAAKAQTRSRSGMSRRSPTGPPVSSLVVMESVTRKTSKTGDMPTPQRTARASKPVGTVFTRVTPALSTHVKATARTPCEPTRRHAVFA